MNLLELGPSFVRRVGAPESPAWEEVPSIDQAEGVLLNCPLCGGAHPILCWSPVVQPDLPPGPGRWNLRGTSLADLTLVGVSSDSVHLRGGCGAHFFVRGGKVEVVT